MPRTVSSSEAKSRFGELVKWTTENQDTVVVKLYGEPAAVIISYHEYMEMEGLRKREQKRKALEAQRDELVAKAALGPAAKAIVSLIERMRLKARLEKCKDDLKTKAISDMNHPGFRGGLLA